MSSLSVDQQYQQDQPEEDFAIQLTLKSMMDETHWFAQDTPDTRRLLIRSHAFVPSSHGGSWYKKSALHDVVLLAGLTWKKEGKDWVCTTDPSKLHTVNVESLGGNLTQKDLNNPGAIIVHQLGDKPISSDSVRYDGSSKYFREASVNESCKQEIVRPRYPMLSNILNNPESAHGTARKVVDKR